MMYQPFEFFIGLRYTRAKRRNHFISFISMTSMLGIMLGIMALIVVLSVMNGFHKEIRERILGMASHATISAPRGGMTDWQTLMDQVMRYPRVTGCAPYVEAQGMLLQGRQVSGVVFRGILPEQEGAVSDVGTKLLNGGQLADLKPGQFDVILGKELALVLGVDVGEKVTLVTPQLKVTPIGVSPQLKRFTVVGLFEVGMGDYDRSVALLHLKDAAKLLHLGEGVSGIRLQFDDLFAAPKIAREIAFQLPGVYLVRDWTQRHQNFFRALHIEKRMMAIILFLIVAVAAFNIVSTLVMVVTDKRSDIAILRTLGASPGSITAIFVIQGAAIGLLGTLFGVLGGVVLAMNVEFLVTQIEQAFGFDFLDPSIYYISNLPSQLYWQDVALIGGSAFMLSLLATLYPAWRAARTQPAEALRYE